MFLDAEDVDLTFRCEYAGFFPSPRVFECPRVQRGNPKVFAEVERIPVEVHHRPRGNGQGEGGIASPIMRL